VNLSTEPWKYSRTGHGQRLKEADPQTRLGNAVNNVRCAGMRCTSCLVGAAPCALPSPFTITWQCAACRHSRSHVTSLIIFHISRPLSPILISSWGSIRAGTQARLGDGITGRVTAVHMLVVLTLGWPLALHAPRPAAPSPRPAAAQRRLAGWQRCGLLPAAQA